MKTLKKSLAAFLVVLLLLTSVPMQAFIGIELPNWFSSEAEALNVNYCSTAAAQWAKDHWNDYDSIILGAGYWNEGGDCANFVSQCLYMGGLNMNNHWDSSGYWAYYTKGNYGNAGSFINAHNLYNYLISIGGQVINNPSASQISIGDVIFYKTTNDDKMHHSAIVTDIVNGTPVVAAHSTNGTRYNGHAYSLGYSGSRIYLIKLYGSTCVNYNPRSFDVYIASNCGSAGRRCYTAPSPYVGYNFTFSSGEYAHVDRVVYEYGIYFGHTYGYGANGWYEGWIILDNFWHQRHVDSATVTHTMGGWYVESNATCTTQGVKKNICSRCGHTETQKFGPNGHNWANATCTSAKYCKTCRTTSGSALGHSWGDWVTTKPSTCNQNGVKTRSCNRCGKTESQNLNITDHTWGSWAVKTPATCLDDGLDNRFCKVCNLEQTRKSNAVGHNYEIGETVKSTCTDSGYDIYTCTRCGDSYTETVDALGHLTGENGDIIEFGSYPQSKVTDADLINELQSKLGLMQSYGYYEGTGVRDDGNMKPSYLMEHGTVYHNGNKYEVVSISSYRPSNVGLTSESNYQEANGYDRGGEMYWFKYEPIKWRIIDKSKGLVICESILDSQPYNNVLYLSDGYYWNSTADKKYYANDWKNSTLREWLNNDFYNTAFSEEEKKVIDITNVETSEYSDTNSGYIYKPSSDNVFLLSYQELTDSAYGFTNSNRIIRGTDYAKSQGLYCLPKDNGYYGNHYWYTRTPGANSADLYRIGYDGSGAPSYTGTNTDNTYYGIVPAFCFDVSSGILGSCVKAKEPTCTESGNTESKRCLRCDALLVAGEEIPALGHNWGETVKVEPTCLEKGSNTQNCTRCGITEVEDLDALGHDFDVTLEMPTCTENGTSTSVCARCSYTETIDTGWTPWSKDFTEEYFIEKGIPSSMYEVKSKYRYRDKIFDFKLTHTPEQDIPEGWDIYSLDTEYGEWGDTIGPVYSDPGNSDTRMSWSEEGIVGYEKTTEYHYYRYTNESGSMSTNIKTTQCQNLQRLVLPYKLVLQSSTVGADSEVGYKAFTENENYNTPNGKYITLWLDVESEVEDPTKPIYGTCWYYKERIGTYAYIYWKWGDWSEGILTKPEELDWREIEVYTESRVKLDALGHECDEEWVLTKMPTCTENGVETAQCVRHDNGKTCDKTYTRYIEAVGHSLVKTGAVVATCLTDGNNEYYTCSSCNKYFSDETAKNEIQEKSWIIPACGHNDGKWICIDEGYEDFVADTKEECDKLIPKCGYSLHFELHCTRCINATICDAILDEYEITAKDHEMSESDRKEATCLEGGYIVKKCNYCDYTESEILDKAEHNWSDWTTIKESSCVHPGEEERHCTNECDTITVEYNVLEAEATEHNYVEAETITSDCQVGTDLIHYICNRCGETDCESCNNINKPHHYWNGDPAEHNVALNKDKIVVPTCTEQGLNVYECINEGCTYSYTEVINVLGHSCEFSNHIDYTCTESGYDIYVCQRDNCDYTYNVYSADCPGHDYSGEYKVKTKADCVSEGLKELSCIRINHGILCNEKLDVQKISKRDHRWSEWQAISQATCEVDGLEKRDCQNTVENDEYNACDAYEENILKAIGHDWDNGVIDPESTCKIHGTKTYICHNDNSHKKTESVALNPNNHVGETYIKDAKTGTCTADGYTGDKYCSDCDELLEKGEAIAKLGHDWAEWKVSKDATIDAKGEEKRICKRDSSHIETRETDKLVSYTAYFIKANEKGYFEYNGKKYDLVDTVRFAKGTTAIVNPDVPEEEGFIGYWEEYTLSNEDIYIEAVYEMKSNDNQSDLISEKDVVYKDGVATITLSAFAETLNAKVPMGATPVDIILVLDQSSSMINYKIGDKKRLEVLKDVAKDFVTTVYESAEENEVDHRIALVSFSGTAENYKGTGLIGTNGSIKTFNKLTDADYASAFVAVNGNLNALKNGIDSLEGISGTSSDYGLQMARQILANNKDGREKLVLFITDGEPGDPGRNMGAFNYTVANDAIEFANQIKNLYGTTIYSIGVAAGASPSDETNKINKFLHYVSSNYPNAKSMNNKGTAATMKNYFLSAEDADEIEKMFESIVSRQIVNTISFTKVNFYDTISEYFTLTTENENALREAVKAEYGVSDSDIIITRNADGTTTVRINNLVPKAVFNEKNVHIGYGATVKFDVTANEKTLEGGTFVTNTEDAGIENGGKTVIEFKVPEGKEISSGRAIVEFRIGDEVYAIREVSIGDKVIVPETDVADWVVTDGTTITSDYTVFNTEYTSETRTVKWIIDGVTKEETYHIGEIIFAPQINNPDGKLFKGWNAKVPYRMPDYDLEFTAIFETHEHNYKQTAINGECTTGVTYTYTCDCEDSYTKTETYDAHKFTANVQLVNNESVATMTCTVCGKADSKVINYKAQYETNSWWNKTTKVVDLTLYDNAGISIQPDGYVYVKLYEEGDVLSNAKSGKLIVKRVNEDGSEDNIPYLKNSSVDKTGYYVEGNYIVLKLDHFSYYALIMPEDATNVPTYGEIECAFNGHSYTSKVTAPTCKSEGYTTYTCLVCGDSYVSDKTDRTAHKYNKNVTSANCTDKGYTTYVCNVCGHSYKDNYTSALGHSMGAYVVTKQPTCTDKGTETATCSRCTHSETKSVAAKGHNYKNNVCTNCGKSKVENCNHLCHKKGFMGFIWKIVRFFWKLFKMNPVCDCGAKHY